MTPIWKDYYFTINKTSAEFRLRLNDSTGAIIYTGRAVARPGASSISIRVNDICADYIQQSLPVWGQEFTPSQFSMKFMLQYLNGAVWASAGTVEFSYDWSYDPHYLASRDGLSFPINKVLDSRQYLLFPTLATSASINATIYLADGSSFTQVVTIYRTADFNNDYNNDFAFVETAPSPGTAVLDLSSYANAVAVVIGGIRYEIDRTLCHTHAIYYVNEYGGWESLLAMGRTSETDVYTRHNQGVEYDNTVTQNRGTRNYVNEVEKILTMNTGWLTDEGSLRMHHLIGSTFVYVQDLFTGDIFPVLINNTESPRKTYKGEGNKLVNYTLEMTIAHDMIRR